MLRALHLLGSVPLADAESVFRLAADMPPGSLRRIPDGETGARTNWINFQYGVFAANPGLEPIADANAYAGVPHVRRRPGTSVADVRFGELGYAAAAEASYATFAALKRDGAIPSDVRFQVSLPTPLAPVQVFVVPEDFAVVAEAYAARMSAELNEILDSVPHGELAIQWDVAVETQSWRALGVHRSMMRKHICLSSFVRLGNRGAGRSRVGLPSLLRRCRTRALRGAEGPRAASGGHRRAPSDGIDRPIQWIHMPVPRDRDDIAYFEPLRALRLFPETQLFLGLVHLTDGLEGARRRIAAAEEVVRDFGIGSECGMGRRPPESIVPLLALHADLSEESDTLVG